MKTLRLVAKDFKETSNYWKEYIGKEDVSCYDGHIEIEGSLGVVRFEGNLKATGHIVAEAGTGIEAGEGIKAGWGIESGQGIKAGWGIEAGEGIKAGWGIEAGTVIKAGFGITCRLSLNVAYQIFAGISIYKKEIKESEKTITCGKLEHGEIAYGILKETGMPEELTKVIELNGKKYRLIEE